MKGSDIAPRWASIFIIILTAVTVVIAIVMLTVDTRHFQKMRVHVNNIKGMMFRRGNRSSSQAIADQKYNNISSTMVNQESTSDITQSIHIGTSAPSDVHLAPSHMALAPAPSPSHMAHVPSPSHMAHVPSPSHMALAPGLKGEFNKYRNEYNSQLDCHKAKYSDLHKGKKVYKKGDPVCILVGSMKSYLKSTTKKPYNNFWSYANNSIASMTPTEPCNAFAIYNDEKRNTVYLKLHDAKHPFKHCPQNKNS